MNPDRKDFLLAMYKELFNNIDRHISIVWQSIGVIVSMLGAFLLSEKYHIPSFLTIFIVIVMIGWTIARLIDAEHWYDRNIHIISNIEKIFLTDKDDDVNIHFYFKKNRTIKSRLESVVMQSYASTILWIISLLYFNWRIPKSIAENSIIFGAYIELFILLFCTGLMAIWLYFYRKQNVRAIEELRQNSPGLNM